MARELQLLAEFTRTTPLNAGVPWEPSPREGGGELDTREMAEVVFFEYDAPHDGTGVPGEQDLLAFYPVLDGDRFPQFMWFPGRYSLNFWPRRQHVHNGEYLTLGDSLVDVLRSPNPDITRATTLKYKRHFSIVALAGASNVTYPFRIRAWGYRYKEDEFRKLVTDPATGTVRDTLDGTITIRDPLRDRTFQINIFPEGGGRRQVTWDTWDTLPGGPKQDKPRVFPFFRYARNAQPTTVNVRYDFRRDQGFVARDEENLYFNYDLEKTVLFVRGLGVRAHPALKSIWIHVSGDPVTEVHPRGAIPATYGDNPIHFGHASELYPVDYPKWFTIPRFGRGLLIWNEKAWVSILDRGTSIPANGVTVAMNGTIIELRQEQA